MTAQILDMRWIAPPTAEVHPRLALVKHRDMLFSYSELVIHVPFEHLTRSIDERLSTPQAWWDDLVATRPEIAERAADRCHPQDFSILDLWGMRAVGHG